MCVNIIDLLLNVKTPVKSFSIWSSYTYQDFAGKSHTKILHLKRGILSIQ
jgi:hypothetical protein